MVEIPGLFPETHAKEILRRKDRTLVAALYSRRKELLDYTGLAGMEATDIKTWLPYLKSASVVQKVIKKRSDRVAFETSVLSQIGSHFSGSLEFIYMDVWEYMSSPEFVKRRFPLGVLNLDFCGGLVYQDMEYPKQRRAFQNLFRKAAEDRSEFLLLVTLMPRDRGKKSYREFVADSAAGLLSLYTADSRERLKGTLNESISFHGQNNLLLFKVCIPLLVSDVGRSHNFSVVSTYTRIYGKMIHFALEANFMPGKLGLGDRPEALVTFLNKPIMSLKEDGTVDLTATPRVILP